MSDLPTPVPDVNPETESFWEATDNGSFLLRQCLDCDEHYHYPRTHCPFCFGDQTEWNEAVGYGEIYSYTVTHQNSGEYGDATPYVLAYVELAEGPRIMTNIVGVAPSNVSIGDSVEVVFDETGDGCALPRFTPTTNADE